jgi:membrane associated rhomboid family serine protease
MSGGLRDLKITRGARILLVVSAVVSIGYLIAPAATQANLLRALGATADGVLGRGEVWTLATSPLLEPDFVGLLLQCLMLWMFLPQLERTWGTARTLRFAAATSLAGVAGGVLCGFLLGGVHAHVPVAGLDPFLFASMLGFGLTFAQHPVRFFGAIPMTGRQIAIGVTGLMIAFVAIGQRWVDGAANVSAMLVAAALTSTRGNPRLWWLKWKQARIRRRLGVVEGGKPRDQRWLN